LIKESLEYKTENQNKKIKIIQESIKSENILLKSVCERSSLIFSKIGNWNKSNFPNLFNEVISPESVSRGEIIFEKNINKILEKNYFGNDDFLKILFQFIKDDDNILKSFDILMLFIFNL
jgi:hypothetical protein